ncbi:MAG: aminopeptidase [Promethearchaeota archaeon]
MINEFYEKLAKIVVHYSLEVEKGHRVLIAGGCTAKEYFQALYTEVIKTGAHPTLFVVLEGIQEILYKYGSDEQLQYVDNVIKQTYTEFDRMINIQSDYNTQKFSTVDPKKMATRQGSPEALKLYEIMQEREAKGEFRWNISPFPCQALAQEAKMDLFTYTEFVKKALFLDKEDPVGEWKKLKQEQERLVNILNNAKKIELFGEDTELSFSMEGRNWVNCWGDCNLPDGEVYTSPVEDSVNGTIRFTYPGIYLGREVKNIFLEFKNGKVINATADEGEDLLKEILQIQNADKIGEFAIGTNYGITQFTKNMLFDEKIGGTLHCALGLALQDAGGKNMSSIHWDILKDMKPTGSKVLADGKLIYEEGKWKI